MSALRLFLIVIALAACGGAKKPVAAPAAPAPDPAPAAEGMPADAPAPDGAPGGEAEGGGAPTKSASDPCMGGE